MLLDAGPMRKKWGDAGIDSRGTREREAMKTKSERNPEQDPAQAAEHVANAHQILKVLQERIGKHPELGAAITKLEMALNVLAVKTGGML
jgi:hypothetical protein